MVTTQKPLDKKFVSPTFRSSETRHAKVIDRTYQNNTHSDYTEQITELGQSYRYSDNNQHYWSPPDLSLLYGTPLYDAATETQKLALNHLYWVGNYNHTAVSEATTSLYNLVTNGVFRAVGGYETLCQELEFETDQESYHIRTFQRIGFKTKMGIVGKTILGNSDYSKFQEEKANLWQKRLIPQPLQNFFDAKGDSSPFSRYREEALKKVAKTMLRDKKAYFSDYLQAFEAKKQSIPAPTDGLGGRIAARHWLQFFTLHWGMSPFMACQYYSLRYTANAILKNQEYPYVRYFRELEQKGKFIPTPTAVSFYHLLDEAFHTTISQTIAKDLYKDFPKPTAYEKFISGMMIYRMQCNLLSGLSGVFPGRCVADDPNLMLFFYKLLKSPLFEMDRSTALDWLEKCFCQEHEGFNVGMKYHQSLYESMTRLFGQLDYQWKMNREMSIMKAGGSIEKALKQNQKTFAQFSQFILAQDSQRV
ncbi:MAG: hypothetical protein ACOC0N_08570 [Chroococcales cyanobacterium]